ncbi:hypothetical protein [Actinorhabdospora filicis]|uniref:hypothetical protein n=1 Tax=Actinorhabdospora filicis TaxID=1785913 RepID=UPI0025522858|nr:hypothetical protein [Actinorhabdospora filicis]
MPRRAEPGRTPGPHEAILALQRAAGNAAVAQRFTERRTNNGDFTAPYRVTAGGLYIVTGATRSDATGIWARDDAPAPRGCGPTPAVATYLNRRFVHYLPGGQFLADCAHTAEELMHGRQLAPGGDYSLFRGTQDLFGEGDTENRQRANNWRAAGPQGTDRGAAPNVGEAYAIIEDRWAVPPRGRREVPSNPPRWPYHVAAVVAVDGGDRITVEQAAVTGAQAGRVHQGIVDVYSSGEQLGRTFHARHGEGRTFSVDAITVVLVANPQPPAQAGTG